ncbi:LPS sulfotransferase NodH [Phyllobacterium sp. YR620]|uniref:Stf0 family sulfotransferase n=1 Tax=Phyllobacterium sp. YR620 TaxID=1881066 RepID=UPI000885497C|nr:Stf0 family sulfotransferase [Phyllobacterium sp. YR620]SDP78052.1 LPS sulfotransferase NodH [Phyllobacterium sp. YR620]
MAALIPRLFTQLKNRPKPGEDWHPHLGKIGGLTLESWLQNHPRAANPTKTIIVASEERSGSELFCEMMGQTGVLGRPSEYFNTPWMRTFVKDYPSEVAEQIQIAHRVGVTPNGCFAVKLHSWHFDLISPTLKFSKAFPNPSFVRLTRADLLSQAISLSRARQSGQFHGHMPSEKEPIFSIVEIQRCLQEIITARARWSLYFARNNAPVVHILYENFTVNPKHYLTKVGDLVSESLNRNLKLKPRMVVQRDERTNEWRERFVKEAGDLGRLDRLDEPPK